MCPIATGPIPAQTTQMPCLVDETMNLCLGHSLLFQQNQDAAIDGQLAVSETLVQKKRRVTLSIGLPFPSGSGGEG